MKGGVKFGIKFGIKGVGSRISRGGGGDLDTFRGGDLRSDGAVGFSFVADADGPEGGGIGAFGPLEVAELRRDSDTFEAGLEGLDAEDMLAEPCGGAAGPAVAETVSKTFVTVSAEVSVDIFFAGGNEFIDARGIGDPIEVEILPEGGGAEIEHGAPIGADEIEGGIGVAGFGERLQDIETVEGGDAFGSVAFEDRIGGFAGVSHVGQSEESGAGLGTIVVGDDLASASGGGGAECSGGVVAKGGHEAGAAFEGHDQQGLEAGGDALGVGGAGPVEEAHTIDLFFAVGADEIGEAPEEGGEVRLLGFEIIAVALMEPEIFVDEDPPHGIARDAVHPFGDGGDVAGEVEGAGHDVIEAKDRVDGADLGVHVADPDEAIAFDAVPEVLLHVEMDGVRADLPDLIEPFVIAPEGTGVGEVADLEHGAHLAEFDGQVGIGIVDAHEPKAAWADHFLAEPGQGDRLVANGVIVLGVLCAAEFGHGLGGRFAEADTDLAQPGLVGGHGSDQLDIAMKLAAEIEQDSGRGVGGGGEEAGWLRFLEDGLSGMGFEEGLGVPRAGFALPDDAGRRDVESG